MTDASEAPFAGVIAALCFVWGWGFHWVDLGLLIAGCTCSPRRAFPA